MDINQWFGAILPLLEHIPVVRAVLGFVLVFFLPGFAWALVFFKEVNLIERLAFSFGLSIAIVTLSMIVLNVLLGVKISGVSALLVILVNVIIPFALYYLKRLFASHPQE